MVPSHVGKYAILKPLGRGAMGEVLLGEDPYIGRRVAIKMMRNAEAADAERFLQEARIIGSLSHPNIVLLLEFGFHDGQPFLAMEYLEGTSLDVWQREPRGLDEKLRVMSGLLGALSYAHGRGVLHRDIKPSNVQVMADGQAKLMDFGIARGESGKLTATGTVMGTPEYMAPEILGDATYSPLSDLFSAGVLCYELLSGRNPFSAKTVAACFSNVLHLDPAPLWEARPELPAELARAVTACLSKAPEGRPKSAGAVLEVVEKARRGGGPPQTADEEVAETPRGTQTVAVPLRRAAAPAPSPPAAAPPRVPPIATPARSVARSAAPWVAGLALLIGVAVLWSRGRSEAPETVASAPSAAAVPPPTAVAGVGRSATSEVPPDQPSPDTPTASTLEPKLPVAPPPTEAPRRRSEPAPASRPTMMPTPAPTPEPTAPPPTPSPTAAPRLVASPPPSSPPTPRATPSPAVPVPAVTQEPTLISLSPRQARRGRQAVIEIEGKSLPAEVQVEISRGRQRALGIRVLSRKWKQPGVLRVLLLVDSDTPLDVYSVTLVDGDGRATNSLPLEIGL